MLRAWESEIGYDQQSRKNARGLLGPADNCTYANPSPAYRSRVYSNSINLDSLVSSEFWEFSKVATVERSRTTGREGKAPPRNSSSLPFLSRDIEFSTGRSSGASCVSSSRTIWVGSRVTQLPEGSKKAGRKVAKYLFSTPLVLFSLDYFFTWSFARSSPET